MDEVQRETPETRHDAFISYSQAADGQMARSVQQGLERLAKPWFRLRAMNVFRDKTGLSVTEELWPTIRRALLASRHLVLLLSPQAANSEWVNREIECFRRTGRPIYLVLTEGELAWDPDTRSLATASGPDVVSPALSDHFREEPLWVDLRWAQGRDDLDLRHARFQEAITTLAASIHGVEKSDLATDAVREHRRTRRTAGAAITALVLLLAASITTTWIAVSASNQARVSEGVALDRLREFHTAQARDYWSEGQNLEAAFAAAQALDVPLEYDPDQEHVRQLLVQQVLRATEPLRLDERHRFEFEIAGLRTLEGRDVLLFGADGIHRVDPSGKTTRLSSSTGYIDWVARGVVGVREESAVLFVDVDDGEVLHRVEAEGRVSTAQAGELAFAVGDGVGRVWTLPEFTPVSGEIHTPSGALPHFLNDGELLVASYTSPFEGSTVWSRRDDFARGMLHPELGITQIYSSNLDLLVGLITGSQGRFTITRSLFSDAPRRTLVHHGPDESMPFDLLQGAEISESAGRIATFSRTRARLWNLAGTPTSGLLQHGDNILGMRLTDQDRRLLTWSRDKTIRSWDTQNGKLLRTVELDGTVTHVDESADEALILVHTSASNAHLFDPTLNPVGTRIAGVDGARFSSDGSAVVTFTQSGEVAWRSFEPTAHTAYVKDDGPVFAERMDLGALLVASRDALTVRNLPSLEILSTRPLKLPEREPPIELSYWREHAGVVGMHLVQIHAIEGGIDPAYTLTDDVGTPLGRLQLEHGDVSFAPQKYPGGWLLWNNTHVHVLDPDTFAPLHVLQHQELDPQSPVTAGGDPAGDDAEKLKQVMGDFLRVRNRLRRAELSESGRYALAWSNNLLSIWTLGAADSTPEPRRHSESINLACFVGDGEKHVAVVEDERVVQLDVETLEPSAEYELGARVGGVFHGPACQTIVIVEESRHMANAGDAHFAHVVSVGETPLRVRKLQHAEQIQGAGVSGDFYYVFWGRYVYLYSPRQDEPMVLKLDGDVAGVRIHQDLEHAVTWDVQGEIRVWNTRNGWLAAPPIHFGPTLENALAFESEGARYLLAVGEDGRMGTWRWAARATRPDGISYSEFVQARTGAVLDAPDRPSARTRSR